jgi:hypothetical protein
MRLFKNSSFWNSFLGFIGKTGFSKSLFQNRARLAHSQLVLEQAQIKIKKNLTTNYTNRHKQKNITTKNPLSIMGYGSNLTVTGLSVGKNLPRKG